MNTNFIIKHLQDYNLHNYQERMPITVNSSLTKPCKKKGNALFAVARVICKPVTLGKGDKKYLLDYIPR